MSTLSTATVESRCHLRSRSTSTLLVLTTWRTTPDSRAFPAAAAWAWNALPASVRTTESYIAFRWQIKTLSAMTEHDCASCYCCCDCRHVTCDIAVCTVPRQHFCDSVTLISACVIIMIMKTCYMTNMAAHFLMTITSQKRVNKEVTNTNY